MNNEPGAFIKLEDGTIVPDMSDAAMKEREDLKTKNEKSEGVKENGNDTTES